MGFSTWTPPKPSLESEAFVKNQPVTFLYKKQWLVGTIEKLLAHSAIVRLNQNIEPITPTEKTVINYKNLFETS